MVTFHGERVRGRYVLFRTARQELDDPPDGPAGGPGLASRCRSRSRRCSPAPGSSRAGDDRWAYEIKWDGVRAIALRRAAAASRLTSRNGTRHHARATRSCGALGRALGAHEAVLDGEVVALRGRPPELPAPADAACT